MSEKTRLLDGRYELGELVGRGGMAEVHKGYDTRLGREVAIKVLRSDLARDVTFLARFRREAQSAAVLNHASIVAVYDSGKDSSVDADGHIHETPYIIMEYVEGRTLREVLTERGRLGGREAARITEGILDALAYSHRQGIVHRDIKPANVMLGADGSIKVMDFGIARALADSAATMTQTQAVIGTAQYLSPEQAQGLSVDARSDLYSTGCLLYELLTGRPPFVGDSPVAIAYQHVGEAPPPPSAFAPDLDPALDNVVLHALTKDREARYQSASEFRSDLQATRLGRPISAAAAGAAARSAAPTERLSALGPEPTEVYAVAPAQPPGPDIGDTGTASFPPVQSEERKGRGPLGYLALVLAILLAVGLLGLGVKTYLDGQARQGALVTVPDVTGQKDVAAQLALSQAGLVPRVEHETSDTVEVDVVTRQNPSARTRVDKGLTVTIWVSTGPSAVPVPDLRGKTEQEARQQLGDLKLTVGGVTQVDDSDQDKGKVISSDPAAGVKVAPGTSVTLRVSSGKFTVPNVVGQQQNDATDALTQKHLRVRTTYQQTDQAPEGQVLSQDPQAGGAVDAGTVVSIVVAQPQPTQPTPSPSKSSTPSGSPSPSPS